MIEITPIQAGEAEAEYLRERENEAWLRFVEAVVPYAKYLDNEDSCAATIAADFADAMLAEAKKRGRV